MCPERKAQQKILWAEVKRETGTWKDGWKIRDLLVDERCSWAVLGFLSSMEVGRRVLAEEEDAVGAVSELEVREWLEEQGVGAEELGGEEPPLFLPTPDFMASAGEGSLLFHLSFPFVFSFVIPLVRFTSSWDRPGRSAKGRLQRAASARTADRKRTVHNLATI